MTEADLRFFNQAPVDVPVVPHSVPQVLETARSVKAEGGTAPAAGLWDAYASKKAYKTIIVVTDEEEDRSYLRVDESQSMEVGKRISA